MTGALDARLRTALGLSVAVHLVALAALALVPRAASNGEAIADAPLLRIEHRVAKPKPRPTPRPIERAAPVAATARPIVATVTAATQIERAPSPVEADPSRQAARPSHDPAATVHRAAGLTLTPQRALARAEYSSSQALPAAATAAPTEPVATPAPTTSPSRIALLGPGPLGANYDPMFIPPGAADAVRAEVGAHVTIRVTVDAGGHATDVTFVRFPSDAAVRERVRAELLAARYDAGECDGVKCEKTLVIST